jgi:fido (protein-threonine AMPylation protein)
LIRRGIDSSYISRSSTNQDPELVASTISAHQDVLEALFDFVAQRRELSTSYIKELHAGLLLHQNTVKGVDQFGGEVYAELKKGAYKNHPNNPTRRDKTVHEYCPPEHVASEMDRLIGLHGQHEQRSMPTVVKAAWLHHAFTQIHPFQDGNGRVARALASLVLIRGGLFPLVVNRDDREKYIDALEAADEGDLTALVGVFAGLQKRDLTKAIIYAAEARPVSTVDEAIAVTRDVLAGLQKLSSRDSIEAERRGSAMRELALARLADTIAKLENELGTQRFRFTAKLSDVHPGDVGMLIEGGGVAARMLFLFRAGFVTAEFRRIHGMAIGVYSDPFYIDHVAPAGELQDRFLRWLDDVIIRGLAEWRKTLV